MRHRYRNAFTLIEAIVALVIVSIGVGGIVVVVDQLGRNRSNMDTARAIEQHQDTHVERYQQSGTYFTTSFTETIAGTPVVISDAVAAHPDAGDQIWVLTSTYTWTDESGDARGRVVKGFFQGDPDGAGPPPLTGVNYTLTVIVTGLGHVDGPPGTVPSNSSSTWVFPENADVALAAVEDAGTWDTWLQDVVSTNQNIVVTMDSNKTVEAVFTGGPPPPPVEYSLTVIVDPAGTGTTTPAEGTTTGYSEGQVVSLTATPIAPNTFVQWDGDIPTSLTPGTSVTMDSDKTVTANFTAPNQYDLTVTISGQGTVDVNSGTIINPPGGASGNGGTYVDGTTVPLSAAASASWWFDRWQNDAGGTNLSTSVLMDTDRAVTAVFLTLLPPTLPPPPEDPTVDPILPSNPPGTLYEFRTRTRVDPIDPPFADPNTGWTPWTPHTPGTPIDLQFDARESTIPALEPPTFSMGGVMQPVQAPGDPAILHPWDTEWQVHKNNAAIPEAVLEVVADSDFAPNETIANAFVDLNSVEGTWQTKLDAQIITEVEIRAYYDPPNGQPRVYSPVSSETYTRDVTLTEQGYYIYALEIFPPDIIPPSQANPTDEIVSLLENPLNPPWDHSEMEYRATHRPTPNADQNYVFADSSDMTPWAMFPQQASYVPIPGPTLDPAPTFPPLPLTSVTTGTSIDVTPYSASGLVLDSPVFTHTGELSGDATLGLIANFTIPAGLDGELTGSIITHHQINSNSFGRAYFRGLVSEPDNENWSKTVDSDPSPYTYTEDTGSGGGGGGTVPDFDLDNVD